LGGDSYWGEGKTHHVVYRVALAGTGKPEVFVGKLH